MFKGWIRKVGGVWTPRVQAMTEDACWRELLSLTSEGRTVDKAVLPADQEPSQRGGMGCPRPVACRPQYRVREV